MKLFFTAFGLMCIFEGVMPFLFPQFWREQLTSMLSKSDREMRLVGLSAMVVGLIILHFVHK